MKPGDDYNLVRRFKEGDFSAFEEIMRTYQDRIFSLCVYLLRHREDARDAAQDTFVKVFRSLKGFEPKSSLYTWIYRIAVTTCLDYKRKSRREELRGESLAEDLPSDEPFAEQLYESGEISDSIQQALQKLPEKLRAAIVLREIEELSYEEITKVLHTSAGTVKSRISRAREQLRHLLKKNMG